MVIAISMVAIVLLSTWILASVIEAWIRASQSKQISLFSSKKVSLGAFILLLFGRSSLVPPASLNSQLVPDSNLELVERSSKRDEEVCSPVNS